MNTIALHDKAMEFTDEALLARRRGDDDVAQSFFEKAFLLEKDAALATQPANENGRLFRSILFRSAATLALDCGNLWEARYLIETALNIAPHSSIVKELQVLLSNVNEKLEQTQENTAVTITGFITGADASASEIKVQASPELHSFKVFVPKEKLQEIVSSFWQKMVVIEGKTNRQGVIFLEAIRRAA